MPTGSQAFAVLVLVFALIGFMITSFAVISMFRQLAGW